MTEANRDQERTGRLYVVKTRDGKFCYIPTDNENKLLEGPENELYRYTPGKHGRAYPGTGYPLFPRALVTLSNYREDYFLPKQRDCGATPHIVRSWIKVPMTFLKKMLELKRKRGNLTYGQLSNILPEKNSLK